ncbi:MAG: CbiX/SirB N-terminal domain-containing protein [Planctomycetota bacterium]
MTAITNTVVLAAHGGGDDSPANALVRAAADRLAESIHQNVLPAFNLGEPNWTNVLDECAGHNVTIVPLMLAAGYFTEEVLPAKLRESASHPNRLTITEPIGTQRDLQASILDMMISAMSVHAFLPGSTHILVVAHGTRRNSKSSETTEDLAREIALAVPDALTSTGYVDADPELPQAVSEVTRPNLLVVPFLLGGAGHAIEDLPQAFHLREPTPGVLHDFAGKRLAFLPTILELPALDAIIGSLIGLDSMSANMVETRRSDPVFGRRT